MATAILTSRTTSRMMRSRPVASCVMTKRSFLSDSFDLRVEWNDRLKAPIFGKIDMRKYFIDMDRQYTKVGQASHIDLDIFANAVLLSQEQGQVINPQDIETRFDQLEEILKRFQKTPQAVKLLDSTSHAVVRGYIDGNWTDSLMRILNNRLTFGLILDDFTHTFLINHFIKSQNWRDASKTGILMMHQEEYQVPIAKEMTLLSTFKYAQQLTVAEKLPEWDPQPPPVIEEPEEEVKVRLEELENPDFDDHFDLTKREHLIGKTMAKMAQHGLKSEEIASKSLQFLGYCLYEKWDKVDQLISEAKQLSKDCLDVALALNPEELESKLGSVSKTDFPMEDFLNAEVEYSVKSHADKYIQDQIQTYKDWTSRRELELEKQYEIYVNEAKLQDFDQKKKKLSEVEERLFFFDNYEAMEKLKRTKYAQWRKTWPRRTWAPQIKLGIRNVAKDDYVPPTINLNSTK